MVPPGALYATVSRRCRWRRILLRLLPVRQCVPRGLLLDLLPSARQPSCALGFC